MLRADYTILTWIIKGKKAAWEGVIIYLSPRLIPGNFVCLFSLEYTGTQHHMMHFLAQVRESAFPGKLILTLPMLRLLSTQTSHKDAKIF